MARDFIGYADTPPVMAWPGGARLAIQVSVAYEEGAEYSLLDGPRRETMGEVPSPVPPEVRDLFNESFFRVPRMMSIGLHCRIAGTPARSRSLVAFLEHVRQVPGVWFARRIDIARWWLQHQPPPGG